MPRLPNCVLNEADNGLVYAYHFTADIFYSIRCFYSKIYIELK